MRICILYDCLFPWTVGGAERWYRAMAERLAQEGHEITYLTLRQWDQGDCPQIAGVKVIAVGPRMALYADGKRRIIPPLCFGVGVFWHLLRYRKRYDRLHMASFPFFSLLAAGIVRPFARFTIAVDWFEVWSRNYWRAYLGKMGVIGWWVQKLCAKVPQTAYSFSRLHQSRLHIIAGADISTYLSGLYQNDKQAIWRDPAAPPTLVYAGRMIPEKRVLLLIEALKITMDAHSAARAVIMGNGPDHAAVVARVAELGLADRITLPGFVTEAALDEAMRTATVIAQPSEREGYGLVVVEASARGVPSVVIAGEDNAASELIDDGVNGFVVTEPTAQALSQAIINSLENSAALRQTTREWYARNAERLSIDHSLGIILTNSGAVAAL